MSFAEGMFPEAERFYSQAISLPMFAGMAEGQQDMVIDVLSGCLLYKSEWKRSNMKESIIEQLLNGASLACIMTPDETIPGNEPLHDESLDLQHVIIKGKYFWGMTHHGYFAVNAPSGNFFYFSNFKKLFGTFAPDAAMRDLSSNCNISTTKRYKKFKFINRNRFKLIWDTEGERDFNSVRQAIHEATPLRVALLDAEDVWNLHPVILPQVEKNGGHFVLQTHLAIYPDFFRNQDIFESSWDNIKPYVDDPDVYKKGFMAIKSRFWIGAYHIKEDGTHKSAYDLGRGNSDNSHKRLKIFVEA
jgi:hypothetical protein